MSPEQTCESWGNELESGSHTSGERIVAGIVYIGFVDSEAADTEAVEVAEAVEVVDTLVVDTGVADTGVADTGVADTQSGTRKSCSSIPPDTADENCYGA